jgi:Dockerin type I domain/PEP-CTERM motif
MQSKQTSFAVLLVAAAWSATASFAGADLVTWDIDSAQSSVRLTIPDQTVNIPGTGDVTVMLRDAGSTTQWTDAGGRNAFLDGTVATNYADASSIEFLSGMHDIFALQGVSVRPNPAQFTGPADADNPDGTYAGTATAPAAYGAKVRGTVSIFTVDAAYIALRDVVYDISSGAVPLGAGTTIAASTSNFGVTSASIDADGLPLPLSLGQPIPDTRDAALSPLSGLDTAAGSVINTGGLGRKLTYNISTSIQVDIQGVLLTGSASGQIVAFATLPPGPGDVNFDGTVNIFDINLISAHWNEGGPTADANHDGIVNIFDINLVSANWSPGGSATAVPEPSTFALLAVAGVFFTCWRRRVGGR